MTVVNDPVIIGLRGHEDLFTYNYTLVSQQLARGQWLIEIRWSSETWADHLYQYQSIFLLDAHARYSVGV